MELAELHKRQGQKKGGLIRASHYKAIFRFLLTLKRWGLQGHRLQSWLHHLERPGNRRPATPRETLVNEVLAMKGRRWEPLRQRQLLRLSIQCGVNVSDSREFGDWLDSTWGSKYAGERWASDEPSFRDVVWKLFQAAEDALECERKHEAMPPLGRFVLREARAQGISGIRMIGGRNPTGAVFSLESGDLSVTKRTISKWFAFVSRD